MTRYDPNLPAEVNAARATLERIRQRIKFVRGMPTLDEYDADAVREAYRVLTEWQNSDTTREPGRKTWRQNGQT